MKTEALKFKASPTLETERLILRKLNMKDAVPIFQYASDPEVTKFMLWDTHKNIKDTFRFIDYITEQYKKDEAAEWVVTLKENGSVIGTIGLSSLTRFLCCEIGYTLNRKYWGRGIMTEAASRVIRFAFEEMRVNRIEAMHLTGNDASGRVMQKLGMRYEGTLRKKVFTKGRYWDCLIYSILADEYFSKSGYNTVSQLNRKIF